MVESILYVVLDVLEFMIVGGVMVVSVWILALASLLIERRTKNWRR